MLGIVRKTRDATWSVRGACLVALLAMVALAGCNNSSSSGSPPKAQADWTVFVYGHGDHNLSPSLLMDIVKMSNAQLTDKVKIVVLADFDASATMDEETGEKYPAGANWLLIRGNGEEPDELRVEAEKNLDDPQVLTAAIARAFQDYPAKRYGLVMWDHGGAWFGGFGSDSQDGTQQGNGMTINEVANAVRAGLEQAGLTGERPLEFFGFDTCLLAGAEPAYAFKDLAKVYIANAEIDYGSGWNYAPTFSLLASDPQISALEFGRKEAEFWNQQHREEGVDDRLLRSHVVIDNAGIEALAQASATLTQALIAHPDYALPAATSAYFALPAYFLTVSREVDGIGGLRDYPQFLRDLLRQPQLGNVVSAAQDTLNQLEALTVNLVQGELREENQGGFHIALPSSADLDAKWFVSYQDKSSAWDQSSNWSQFLKFLADNRDEQAPTLQAELLNVEQPSAAQPPTLRLSSPDRDVGNAQMFIYRIDLAQQKAIGYGLAAAGALDVGKTTDLPWDGQLVMIGEPLQPAAIVPWIMQGRDADNNLRPPLLAALGVIQVDGEELQDAFLLFKNGATQAEDLVLVDPDSGQTYSVSVEKLLESAPSAKFVPWVAELDLTTQQRRQTAGAAMNLKHTINMRRIQQQAAGLSGRLGIPVQYAPATAGEYVLLVAVEDVWGNEASLVRDFTLHHPF